MLLVHSPQAGLPLQLEGHGAGLHGAAALQYGICRQCIAECLFHSPVVAHSLARIWLAVLNNAVLMCTITFVYTLQQHAPVSGCRPV